MDNHIQNFHFGWYVVGYTFGNHVLRHHSRVAAKLNFRQYIRRYTSQNENFEYSYPLIIHKKTNSNIHFGSSVCNIKALGPVVQKLLPTFVCCTHTHRHPPIGTASPNSTKFRGIRPWMYIEDLL